MSEGNFELLSHLKNKTKTASPISEYLKPSIERLVCDKQLPGKLENEYDGPLFNQPSKSSILLYFFQNSLVVLATTPLSRKRAIRLGKAMKALAMSPT